MPRPYELPERFKHLTGLRVNDLVAKVARVTLKDTTRVMGALTLVADFLEEEDVYKILDADFSVERATVLEGQKCDEAFAELSVEVATWDPPNPITFIRSID